MLVLHPREPLAPLWVTWIRRVSIVIVPVSAGILLDNPTVSQTHLMLGKQVNTSAHI
jgi:hypothetical protein